MVCILTGIATRYGLDGPGIESRWGRDFPHPSRPAPGGLPGLLYSGYRVFPGGKAGRGVVLANHHQLSAFVDCYRVNLCLYIYILYLPLRFEVLMSVKLHIETQTSLRKIYKCKRQSNPITGLDRP